MSFKDFFVVLALAAILFSGAEPWDLNSFVKRAQEKYFFEIISNWDTGL